MSKAGFRELAAKHNGIVEIPDLYVWVSDDGDWGVGELLVVNATTWTDPEFQELRIAEHAERWETAKRIVERKSKWVCPTCHYECHADIIKAVCGSCADCHRYHKGEEE